MSSIDVVRPQTVTPRGGRSDPGAPRPDLVGNREDFVLHLDRLRRRAAARSGRRKLGLDALARRTGIPRSTLHTYLAGTSLPPQDKLDALVLALGCDADEVHEWGDAVDRIADVRAALRVLPQGDDVHRLPTEESRSKSQRALGLSHCHGLVDSEQSGPAVPAYVCATWTGTYVYDVADAAGRRTGYLYAGNNWVVCRDHGAANPEVPGGAPGDLWLYTQGDVAYDVAGGWGWIPANALVGVRDAGSRGMDAIPWRTEPPRSP